MTIPNLVEDLAKNDMASHTTAMFSLLKENPLLKISAKPGSEEMTRRSGSGY